MIPKVIHCFWAGGPKTKLAKRCLASWKRFAPDWEIKEWNLDNSACRSDFCVAAIERKRWAVVSDYVRMWALREYGGVYFDFDVELVKPIDDLLDCEWIASERNVGGGVWLNPGGGIALERGSPLAVRMLELYDRQGYQSDRAMMAVINENLTVAMAGLTPTPRILPPEVFNPIDTRGNLHRTVVTRGIHWYAMSGADVKERFCRWLAWHGMGWVVTAFLKIRSKR